MFFFREEKRGELFFFALGACENQERRDETACGCRKWSVNGEKRRRKAAERGIELIGIKASSRDLVSFFFAAAFESFFAHAAAFLLSPLCALVSLFLA